MINENNTTPDQSGTKISRNHSASQRSLIKTKLANKYNISLDEAETILNQIEKKQISENIERIDMAENVKTQPFKNNNIEAKKDAYSISNDEKQQKIAEQEKENEEHDEIDSIISNILPNYEKKVVIELSHVDLKFEIDKEKINTLKETIIKSLTKQRTKKVELHVLKDITLTINNGEKVGVIGYNGAGKSTLLNVITGIYPPNKGTVKTYGKISPLLSLGAGFDYNYSGRKNIYLNGAVLGYNKQFLQEKEKEIIEFSELEDHIDFPIKTYSSGMLAKLGFSIATIVNPDILIIDEILGVGDVNFQKKCADKIRSLIDGGTTVLLVSHSIPQIRNLCEKAIWIDNGKIKEIGEVNKVCDNYLKDAEKASREQLANIQFK